MSDNNPDDPPVPAIVKQWVRANPLPTLLLTEDLETLATNEAFANLLRKLNMSTEDLLRGPLATNGSSTPPDPSSIASLKRGDCVVRRMTVAENQHYTFHLIKLDLSADKPCLCCMLIPGDDPSEGRLTGILNAIACFVVEIDFRGNISYVNDQLLQYLGYELREQQELVHLRQIQHGFRDENMSTRVQRVQAEGMALYRAEFIKKSGTVFPVEVSIVSGQTPGESSFLLTARDITLQLAHETDRQDSPEQKQLNTGNAGVKKGAPVDQSPHSSASVPLIYQSAAFAEIMQQVRLVAPTGATVLITGETGTGKELIARTIHQLSQRAQQPFVTVDCGLLPRELIERELFGYRGGDLSEGTTDDRGRLAEADGGTLFLDHVGELPLRMQLRLLRALRQGAHTPPGHARVQRVDVRVIAATNRNLRLWVEQGRFRSDLFYRLNVFPIISLPLRDRREDIHGLIGHFIKQFNTKFSREISGIDDTTLERIVEYSFPGNVGELEAMVEQAFVVAGGDPLPPTAPPPEPSPLEKPLLDLADGVLTEFVSFEANQRKYIQFVLKRTDGKVSGVGGAADILEINPQTLFSKMKKLGLKR